MPTPLKIEADLTFEVSVDGGRVTAGRLTSTGQDLELRVKHPQAFAGSQDAAGIRDMARTLSEHGLSLHVCDEDGNRLVSLGVVRPSWWQRRVTKSRHMRIGGLRGGVTAARGRLSRPDSVLPDLDLRPPGTLFPLTPTFQRRPRRALTTTHQHGGSPRLVVFATPTRQTQDTVGRVHWLQDTAVTTIGSDPGCDIVLDGLSPHHLEVHHNDQDEYVVHASPEAQVRVHGGVVQEQVLRSSSRVEVGGWSLVYARDEHADHGRPYGGRIGGELGRQRSQPPRSSRSDSGPDEWEER